MFKGEKIYQGEKKVKYVFQKSYQKTEGLVIVFSAFSPKGKKPSYNYVRTLEEFDCNKLFILDDFGCRASYYLCENRDFSIERSVVGLINKIVEENEIKNIISCGSSKGGYAAIYYGIKYGFNKVIAASPQYLLGDYLLKQTRTDEVVKFMVGGTSQDDHEFINNIMANMIRETNNNPEIFIHLGAREYHYYSHVVPMIEEFEQAGISYELDLGDYDKHSDVIKFYPRLLKEKIRNAFGFPSIELKQGIKSDYAEFEVFTDSPDNKIAWYVYQDNKRKDYIKYSTENKLNIPLKETGKYKVKAFVVNEGRMKVSVESNTFEKQ